MRHSAIARLMIIGCLTLGLLVPLTWVYAIVTERASRRDEAVREVSATWGGPQTIAGPVLSVPYFHTEVDGSGRRKEVTAFAHILPQELHVEATLQPEQRRRGIFPVTVYRAQITMRGSFRPTTLDWARLLPERIDWS